MFVDVHIARIDEEAVELVNHVDHTIAVDGYLGYTLAAPGGYRNFKGVKEAVNVSVGVDSESPTVGIVHYSVAVQIGGSGGAVFFHQLERLVAVVDSLIQIAELQILGETLIEQYAECDLIEQQRQIAGSDVNLAVDACFVDEAL